MSTESSLTIEEARFMLKVMTGEAVDTYLHSLSEEEERFTRGNIDTFRTYLTEIEGQNLTEQDKLFILPNSDRYGPQTCYGDIMQILNDHMPQATPDEKNSLKPISRKLKAMLQSSARQQILEFAEQATDFVSKGLYFSLANVMQQCGKLTLDRDTILDLGDGNIERIDGITAEVDRLEKKKKDHIVAYKYWKAKSERFKKGSIERKKSNQTSLDILYAACRSYKDTLEGKTASTEQTLRGNLNDYKALDRSSDEDARFADFLKVLQTLEKVQSKQPTETASAAQSRSEAIQDTEVSRPPLTAHDFQRSLGKLELLKLGCTIEQEKKARNWLEGFSLMVVQDTLYQDCGFSTESFTFEHKEMLDLWASVIRQSSGDALTSYPVNSGEDQAWLDQASHLIERQLSHCETRDQEQVGKRALTTTRAMSTSYKSRGAARVPRVEAITEENESEERSDSVQIDTDLLE